MCRSFCVHIELGFAIIFTMAQHLNVWKIYTIYISLKPVSILYTLCFLCFRTDTRFMLTMFLFFSVLLFFYRKCFFYFFILICLMFMSLFCHRIEMFMHRAKECLSFFFFFFFLYTIYFPQASSIQSQRWSKRGKTNKI